MERRPPLAPLVVVSAVLIALLTAYVAGYFFLGQVEPMSVDSMGMDRMYRSSWLATIYKPAAVVETWITGRSVRIGHLRDY